MRTIKLIALSIVVGPESVDGVVIAISQHIIQLVAGAIRILLEVRLVIIANHLSLLIPYIQIHTCLLRINQFIVAFVIRQLIQRSILQGCCS